MKFRITNTQPNDIRELNIVNENNIDYTVDLIGNSGAVGDYIHYNKEDDLYELELRNFEWWENYITLAQADEMLLRKLRYALYEEYDYDEATEIINKYLTGITTDYDYDRHHEVIQEAISEVINSLLATWP